MNKSTIVSESYNRLDYIDILKGIAILLVVMGHVVAMCYEDFFQKLTYSPYIATLFWRFIYSFHMPLFMFVSGFVAFSPQKKYSIVDISKRIMQYLIPFFIVGTLFYYYRDGRDICNYWYLRTLAIFVIGMYVVESISHRWRRDIHFIQFAIFCLIFYFLCHGIKTGSIIDVFFDKEHLSLYIYFALGWLIRRYSLLFSACNSGWAFLTAFIVLFVCITFQFTIHYLTALSGIIVFLKISTLLEESFIKRQLKKIGKYTLGIYLFHFFMLYHAYFMGEYFSQIKDVPSAFFLPMVYSGIVSVFLTYLSIGITKIVKQIPIVSLLFLGCINQNIKSLLR